MPGIGHLALGVATARLRPAPTGLKHWHWVVLLTALSYAPDADVLAFRLGIPYGAPFGHRGALHSLAVSALVGIVLGMIARRFRLPAVSIAMTGGLVMASHGVLDAFTDGGLGVALFWPATDARFFAPWRPIPVSPLGWRVLSPEGLGIILRECVLFLPAWLVVLWPGKR